MALEGPQVAYARVDDVLPEETLKAALELARKVADLLEDTRSTVALPVHGAASVPSTHSTRMARAMAASLVDELEALVRPSVAFARSS